LQLGSRLVCALCTVPLFLSFSMFSLIYTLFAIL
jgi:hypothetical protein